MAASHIIPVFSRVAPFPRDFPFPIHSHLPIKAVQFTILSIIAIGYKFYVASYGSEVSSSLLPVSKTATIDKTLCKYSACFQIFKNSSGHEPKNLLQEEA